MRHRVAGKHLGRTSSHRKALRRNMSASLIQHEAIRTTEAKAKQLRRFVEKLITTAKKGTLHARRQVIAAIGDREMADSKGETAEKTVVQKLFDEIVPRYTNRPGGYTRIIRLAERRIGDSSSQVLLQLVEEAPAGGEQAAKTTSRRRRRTTKRLEAAGAADLPEETEQEQASDTNADVQETVEQDAADKQAKEETNE